MQAIAHDSRDRVKSAVAAAFIHALLGYLLITGLGSELVQEVGDELKLFDVVEPAPPLIESAPADQEESDVRRRKHAEGAASPANLKDTPSQIVVPPPAIRLEVPPPVVAAPAVGSGNSPSAGAAPVPGPGTGSGGQGTGLGSGDRGSGTGGGAVVG